MIYTLAYTQNHQIKENLTLEQLKDPSIKWYWVDFSSPTDIETNLLDTHFRFHPLAIDDCLNFLQRPKVDHYEGYSFYVFHALLNDLKHIEEVDCFFGSNFLVSFHKEKISNFKKVKDVLKNSSDIDEWHILDVFHELIDTIVDMYFPIMYKLEDTISELDENTQGQTTKKIIEDVFEIRSSLIRLRKSFIPMRELLYRMINTSKLINSSQTKPYFVDIYDHLLKLCEMLETNRDLTADIRDSNISLNANRMNSIMMTLTIITTIFMPLTFIAGVYGMNFTNMPELNWKYGYFAILIVMLIISLSLFFWFRKKGWFKNS